MRLLLYADAAADKMLKAGKAWQGGGRNSFLVTTTTSGPIKPTRKYLIRDDQVRLDKEVKDFYKITYFTKDSKSEGWIKKSDVE